ALEIHAVPGPGLKEDLHAFFHAPAALLLGNAVAVELHRSVTAAEADDQATATDNVERSGLLGQAQRVMKRNHVDGDGQLDSCRTGGHGGQKHAWSGGQAVVGVVVLGEPDRVEAEFFGQDHLVDFLADDVRFRVTARRLQEVVSSEAHQADGTAA